jgi:hypothetical protein
MKNVLSSALVMSAMFLTGCSGSSSQFGSATSGITPSQDHQLPTRTLGPAGLRKVGQYTWVWDKFVIPPNISVDVYALCPSDHVVIGGGYDLESGSLVLKATKPNAAFDRWIITGARNHSDYIRLTVYAVCAPS